LSATTTAVRCPGAWLTLTLSVAVTN